MTTFLQKLSTIWKKHYAIPSEHGSWIWWIGPLLLGACAGGKWRPAMLWLTLAALAAFLSRQPASILIKTFSGRRPERDRIPALVWLCGYSALAALAVSQLIRLNHGQVLWLAVPAVPILGWHFSLIAKRRERKQMGIEIIGTGALALAAPAAYWVSGGTDAVLPLILWLSSWLQSAASITLVYFRLDQKTWDSGLALALRARSGYRTLAYHGFNFLFGWSLVCAGSLNAIAGMAFSMMLLDTLLAIVRPAINARPRSIGLRQLFSSSLFYLLMILSQA
jgi:hypothetical protein